MPTALDTRAQACWVPTFHRTGGGKDYDFAGERLLSPFVFGDQGLGDVDSTTFIAVFAGIGFSLGGGT